ncbi:hypothetical protein IWZ01DRAFT_487098 [Phyllosticta capitalensis]
MSSGGAGFEKASGFDVGSGFDNSGFNNGRFDSGGSENAEFEDTTASGGYIISSILASTTAVAAADWILNVVPWTCLRVNSFDIGSVPPFPEDSKSTKPRHDSACNDCTHARWPNIRKAHSKVRANVGAASLVVARQRRHSHTLELPRDQNLLRASFINLLQRSPRLLDQESNAFQDLLFLLLMSFASTAADIISAGEQNLIHSRASAAEGGPTAQRVRDGGTSTLALCGRNNEPKMKHSHQNAERRGSCSAHSRDCQRRMTGATPTLSRCCPFSIPLALLLLNFLSNRYSCVLDGVDRAPWWLRDTICSLLLRDHHAISDHDSSVDLVQHVRLLVNAVHAFFELLELPADQQQPACGFRCTQFTPFSSYQSFQPESNNQLVRYGGQFQGPPANNGNGNKYTTTMRRHELDTLLEEYEGEVNANGL